VTRAKNRKVTRAKNRVMKTVNLVGIGVAGISAMVAVAAHGQRDSAASTSGPKAEAVVDAAGNLHVADDYRANVSENASSQSEPRR
jgi:hypothetical protein